MAYPSQKGSRLDAEIRTVVFEESPSEPWLDAPFDPQPPKNPTQK